MKKCIAFVSYFYSENDGVGSARSISLSKLLKENENNLKVFSKSSFGDKKSDNKMSWSLNLFVNLIKTNYDVLYVSCGPFFHLYFILLTCIIKKKDLIVDFRDPWSLNLIDGFGGTKAKGKHSQIRRAQFVEKALYKRCKYFWVCTPGMKKAYGKLFGDESKIRVVLNGHTLSEEVMDKKVITNNLNMINFVCIGKFVEYGEAKAENLLRSILDKFTKDEREFSITFIGTDKNKILNLAKRLKLEDKIIMYERKPYEEAIFLAQKSDIGICLLRNEDLEFGTKVFDYIGMGIPIYDYFRESSSFRDYFRPYLTKLEPKEISKRDRYFYKRENLFTPFLSDFE